MVDLERFRSGDPGVWAGFVRQCGPMMLDVTTGFAKDRDEAEDWAQEAWARAFRKRRAFRGQGSIRGWLMVLTRNLCLNRLQSRKRRLAGLELFRREPRELVPNPLELLEEADQRRAVREAIARLPRRQREAVILWRGDEREISEIAEVMSISEATVRSLISKGIARLAREERREE